MIRQLEEQLKEKQRDLVGIQQKKPRDSPEYNRFEHKARGHPTPYDSPEPVHREPVHRDRRKGHPPSRPANHEHPPSRNDHRESVEKYTPPTKPKKVMKRFPRLLRKSY